MATTSRQRVIRTLTHQPLDRAPRDLWTLPAVEQRQSDEIRELLFRFPVDFERPDFRPSPAARASGRPHEVGQYTDAWGCVWHVSTPDMPGEVKGFPLADVSAAATYRPPVELLDRAAWAQVDRGCAATNRFVLARTDIRPFERLQFLRGPEATFIDLAYGTRQIRGLLAMLHEFYMRELELWAQSDVDGVAFADDWGSQTALLVAPDLWRDLFRPLYRDYCDLLHRRDKFAFFHSDGQIADILDDLVGLGIDAINAQLTCLDLERVAREFRGRITFWGQTDGQHTLPFGSVPQVRQEVDRVRQALDFGRGGLIAQCEWSPQVPYANIVAVFDQWLRPLPMHIRHDPGGGLPGPRSTRMTETKK